MVITNPIYDVVFKFLMDDIPIAKGLIGSIIGEKIVELHFASKEIPVRPPNRTLTVFRLDFMATIRAKDGGL